MSFFVGIITSSSVIFYYDAFKPSQIVILIINGNYISFSLKDQLKYLLQLKVYLFKNRLNLLLIKKLN
ncbi:hypothetical protein CW748_16445 [Alteromonadales bacterium alter-6D02]|nr:hypothetical protein CW748_16445 [Alteromonadales bacterium alter-6D02]